MIEPSKPDGDKKVAQISASQAAFDDIQAAATKCAGDALYQANSTVVEDWQSLYRRMRNVAAGYSNLCDESGTTRRLERECEQIEADYRTLKAQS